MVNEKESSLSRLVLDQLLSWIYELQEQILNSAPIKALIESAEQWDEIYNKQTIVDIFAKLSSIMVGDSVDSTKNNIDTKATIADIYPVESIDMTMVLNEAAVAGWILPTVAIGSDNLFGADAGFNGLGGLNVF